MSLSDSCKIRLTSVNPFLPRFLPQPDSPLFPVDLSVGDIRWQIAAEWLEIAQWSQWTAYKKSPSLFQMVPSRPQNGVANATCMCACISGGERGPTAGSSCRSSAVVRCDCGVASCIECNDRPHWPATCSQSRDYDKMRQQRGTIEYSSRPTHHQLSSVQSLP